MLSRFVSINGRIPTLKVYGIFDVNYHKSRRQIEFKRFLLKENAGILLMAYAGPVHLFTYTFRCVLLHKFIKLWTSLTYYDVFVVDVKHKMYPPDDATIFALSL